MARFDDLWAAVPPTRRWRARGRLQPWRSPTSANPTPYALELEAEPLHVYELVSPSEDSDNPRVITADSDGLARFEVALEPGDNAIELVDVASGRRIRTMVSARRHATLLAAAADLIEARDTAVDEMDAAKSILTVSGTYIHRAFGDAVAQGSSPGRRRS